MRSKRIKIRSAVLLILTALFMVGCREQSEISPIPAVTITSGGETVFSNSDSKIVFAEQIKSGAIEFKYEGDIPVKVKLSALQDEQEWSREASFEKSGSTKISVEEGKLYCVSLEYYDEKAEKTVTSKYPANEEAFLKMLSPEGTGDNVVLGFAFEGELVNLQRPCNLILQEDLRCDTLYISGDFEGKVVIDEDEGDLEAEDVFADGTGIVLEMPKIKKIEANPSYYLRVKAYNNRVIDYKTVTVTGNAAWERLYSEETLPKLYPDTKVVFSGNFVIENKISIDFPISFGFEKGVKLSSSISIKTDDEVTLTFEADNTAELPDYPIDLEGENVDVVWDIPRNYGITMYEIALHLGAKTINGKTAESYALGGDGAGSVSSITLHKTDNKNITKSVIWKVDGYVLKAVVDCVADPNTLKNAKLDVNATPGSTYEFDESVKNEDGTVNLLATTGCYLTVTDKNGKSVRYLVETEYDPSPLPIVVIEVEGGKEVESNETYQNATIYMTTDGCEYSPLGKTTIQIRGRGHSTWKWEKKPYKIKFDQKTSLFGLEANKDWTLLANYTDKSLIRNYVAMEGAKILSFAYTPSQFPVDVFVNGEYVGIYTMGEQLEVKDGRVELEDRGSEKDTGFLLEIGGTSSEDVWNETCFYTTLCKYVKVKAPDADTLTKEQVGYIRDYVKKADEAVMKGVGYEEYIDLEALIDWVIVHELYYNIDCAFRRSCYFTKDAGGKLTMGPIWDFDNAFGNFWKDDKTYSTWATADSTSGYIWDNWMTYLINYPEFREKFRARWDEVKYDLLDELLKAVDEGNALCERSAEYNFEVWDILNRRVGCQDSSIKQYNTYEKQINYLRSFIKTRWKWMDESI